MNIQSLSIVVPTERCVNDCAFCVSKQHTEDYGKNRMFPGNPEFHRAYRDFQKRMAFARDNGCNVVMLTGDGEPTQNKTFLTLFARANESLDKPFRHISIQTAGAFLDEQFLTFLRDDVGVNTISLSLSALNDAINAMYTGHPGQPINIAELCHLIKSMDFNLRLSLNMTDAMADEMRTGANQDPEFDARRIFNKACALKADQVTFRILYADGNTPQAKWIGEHTAPDAAIQEIKAVIKKYGRPLERLAFGQIRYDVKGLSTVLDDDCMSTEAKEELKYLILRPNCKLYTKWDSTASLLF